MCQRPTSEGESDREDGRRRRRRRRRRRWAGCGDAACRIPFSPSREAIEFASRRALVCEPRDRMSRAGFAFPAIPAVRTRHRPGDIAAAGRDEYARPRPYPYRRCEAVCTRLFRCFSLLREGEEKQRDRERKRESEMERDRERARGGSIVPVTHGTHLSSPTN